MRMPWKNVVLIGVLGLIGCFIGDAATSGSRRMTRLRSQIAPGMSITQIRELLGDPSQVLRQGEPLKAAHRSYQLPEIDEHTMIYFYPMDGIPYFNVYVLINEPTAMVTRVDIENLWW